VRGERREGDGGARGWFDLSASLARGFALDTSHYLVHEVSVADNN
jgi:hypothetical protein